MRMRKKIWPFIVCLLALAPIAAYAQSVQITAPADGTTVNPGQTLSVTVTGSASVQTAMITVEKPLPAVKETSPLHYMLTLPINIPEGVYHIRAMAQANGKFVESAPIALAVEWPGKLVKAEPYPVSIAFDKIGENTQLKILGTFDNGAQADVARSGKSAYVTTDPGVVTVSLDGVVTSLGLGDAKIIFRNSGVLSVIPVGVHGAAADPGNISYNLHIAAATPLDKGEDENYYTAHIDAANKGSIPLAYVKVLEATLNDQPAPILPPAQLNIKMGDKWAFDLGFPAAAGARGARATLHIKGIYSPIPEFYHKDQPFDSVIPVELP